MELKEYLKIISRNRFLYLVIIGLSILSSFAFFWLKPVSYNTSLMLNITRAGSQITSEYKYDNFYRIQADEKFAETLVEWLKSPVIVSEIQKEAGIDGQRFTLGDLKKLFKAEKMSSQMVSVSFGSPSLKEAQNLSRSISKILSEKTAGLNEEQKEDAWFEIISENPMISKFEPDFKLVFAGAFLFGLFFGFWIVMLKHYLE